MLFRPKHPKNPLQKLWSFCIPPPSWRRMSRYYHLRILRLASSDHSIALGMASGCAVSFTPTFGFHILQCFLFCIIFRANFFAAVIASLIGNLWTFPVFMWLSYQLGDFIVSMIGYEIFAHDNKTDLFFITLIGGYAIAVINFPLFYIISRYLVCLLRRKSKRKKL